MLVHCDGYSAFRHEVGLLGLLRKTAPLITSPRVNYAHQPNLRAERFTTPSSRHLY